MTLAIRAIGLTHDYGQGRGVLDLDLEVRPGEVFGYLGPNGAGKTTTIRTLLDFIRPTRGRAEVLGLDSHASSVAIHRRTGYLAGEFTPYLNLTGAEFLRFSANLRGDVDWAYAEQLAERLDCDLRRKTKQLSHGNRRKVGLIGAFMHHPELLVLDEPTQGLDPLIQQEFYGLVDEARSEGRTVFLSSHVLPEIEHLCDRVGIIRDGRLLAVESVADLRSRALRRLEIHFGESVPEGAFAGLPGVRDVTVRDGVLACTVSGSLDAVIKHAAAYRVENVISQEPSLEEIFLAFYGSGEHHAAA